jgi:hypothetical protein
MLLYVRHRLVACVLNLLCFDQDTYFDFFLKAALNARIYIIIDIIQ